MVGGGVIGAGWAARLLLNGIDVALFDPDPEIERKMGLVLDNARRAMARLLPGALPPRAICPSPPRSPRRSQAPTSCRRAYPSART